MQFIKTIIAFFFLYVFVGAIAGIIVFCAWLTSFSSDASRQLVGKVIVTAVEPNIGAEYTYYKKDAPNAFKTMVTRGDIKPGTGEQAVLAARSTVLVASYTKVTLADWLVPLGFRTMYKLTSVRDAGGKTVFHQEDPILSIIEQVGANHFSSFFTVNTESLPLVASSTPATYTIVVDDNGLHQEVTQ